MREATEKDGAVPPENREDYNGIVTSFKVLLVVKGECKDEKIDIFHFDTKKPWDLLDLGAPYLVRFIVNPTSEYVGPLTGLRDYLLFLTKGKDGQWTFVSGQFTPVFSVK